MNATLESFCNCRRCTNLSLEQRMEVIREYESHRSKKPSIKSLASKFDCCYSEIKKILLNRDSILCNYKAVCKQKSQPKKEAITTFTNNKLKNVLCDAVATERQDKITFLGKVMYEYIQRVLYSNYSINDEKVLQKAREFKYHLGVEYFEPNNTWLDDFKKTYGIRGFDLKCLRRSIKLKETKRPHLSATDIVEYVRRQERQAKSRSPITDNNSSNGTHEPKTFYETDTNRSTEDGEDDDVQILDGTDTNEVVDHGHSILGPNLVFETDTHGSNEDEDDDEAFHLLEPMLLITETDPNRDDKNDDGPTVVYENIDDDDVGHVHVHNNSLATHPKNSLKHPDRTKAVQKAEANKRPHHTSSSSPLTSIESVEEALEHLKILEEYAMLQDNFRAIGLLTQLEQVFKKQPKTK